MPEVSESEPDTDDEVVDEDDRFHFFYIASHQVMSKVSRRTPPMKITFGHIRRGLERNIGTEFRFVIPRTPAPPCTVHPCQEEDTRTWRVLRELFGIKDTGSGTASDPYQIHIKII